MFYLLSKTVTFLIMPLTIIIILLILGIIFRRRKWGRIVLWTGLGVLLFFSNRFIAYYVMRVYEARPVPVHSLEGEEYDAAILLSGFVQTGREETGITFFNDAGDRAAQTLILYQQGYVDKIIVTGGGGYFARDRKNEAHRIRDWLEAAGVPGDGIIVEDQARNTRENAAFTAPILEEQFPDGRFLLVTSAFHMRRAEGCFSREGIEAEPFPTDYRTGSRPGWTDIIVPAASSLEFWTVLFKEWIGLFAYKAAGYL
ncbi:MAG: YdcF family protein [Spirochaetia bacterium]